MAHRDARRGAAPQDCPASAAPTPVPPAVAAPEPGPPPPNAGAGLDRRNAQRLKRGQMAIEARLDLHGMTQDEAHRALGRFVTRRRDEGRRARARHHRQGHARGRGRAAPRGAALARRGGSAPR